MEEIKRCKKIINDSKWTGTNPSYTLEQYTAQRVGAVNDWTEASEEGEMDIRKMFESDSDDEDEETANGTGATLEGGEDDEDGNEESERPELGGLCVVDKREGIFNRDFRHIEALKINTTDKGFCYPFNATDCCLALDGQGAGRLMCSVKLTSVDFLFCTI